MSCLLLTDCLNEVLEYLEDDKTTLHSCLLVNHLWCGVSVRILWRSFKHPPHYKFTKSIYRFKSLAILSTLISCLPNESKELLHKNEIFISTPTSRPPLFNYVAFCKVISINEIYQEIIQMFMNQVSSLKKLTYYTTRNFDILRNSSFTYLPGTKDRLRDLSELCCSSNIRSEFFYQLSQICHNLQTLTINFISGVSNELKELISSQNNLKNLYLSDYSKDSWADIVPTLAKHSDTLTKLHLGGDNNNLSLSFVSSFSNLQEIKFKFDEGIYEKEFENFKELQYASFPKLRTLNIYYRYPNPEPLINFLEINGKNLIEFVTYNELNLSIIKFCPNLRNLFVLFKNDELDILRTIFDGCQYLESISILCGDECLNEKEVLDVVAKHSPKNFHELKIYNVSDSILSPDDLESFFISWKNRIPKNSLSLIIIKDAGVGRSLVENRANMRIIEKYGKLGVIKCETTSFKEEIEIAKKYIS